VTNRRYIELRLLDALEYIKYSNETSWTFLVRVGDKNICLAGEKINEDDSNEKNIIIDRFLETLNLMEFSIDEKHIIELINDLKVVKLFKYINECINDLDNFRNNLKSNTELTMNSFTIQSNEYLSKNIQAYYHQDYTTFGAEGNPDYINYLKNQFGDTNVPTLQSGIDELKKILGEDLPKIKLTYSDVNLTVCVIPRAKTEGSYSENQKFFKKVVSVVVDKLSGFINGTTYIIRHTNTKTTHMSRSGYGGDGNMPYPGITKDTCNISDKVKGKDILLIDDIYTKTINIDEDAIQALLDKGAKSVFFYSVGKTVSRH
jgi:hypothetical protein